eukprot:m.184241 g.184241  ORF g.184241 m.184241 type:complete len:52 (+) comp16665_c1_seq2:4256-4411(+)
MGCKDWGTAELDEEKMKRSENTSGNTIELEQKEESKNKKSQRARRVKEKEE